MCTGKETRVQRSQSGKSTHNETVMHKGNGFELYTLLIWQAMKRVLDKA